MSKVNIPRISLVVILHTVFEGACICQLGRCALQVYYAESILSIYLKSKDPLDSLLAVN